MENSLFPHLKEDVKEPNNNTCGNCKWRERFSLSQHCSTIIQCCVRQPSKKSNSGFKTVKRNKTACEMWFSENKTIID